MAEGSAATAGAVVEVTAGNGPGGPNGAEVRAAFSRGVEGAEDEDVPRIEDMENLPGPEGVKRSWVELKKHRARSHEMCRSILHKT